MDIQSLLNKESDTDSEERTLALISRENAIRSSTGTLPPIHNQADSTATASQSIPSIPSILALSLSQPQPETSAHGISHSAPPRLHSFATSPAQAHRQTPLGSVPQPAFPIPQASGQGHPSKVISSAIEKSPASPKQGSMQRTFQATNTLENPSLAQTRASRYRSTSYPLRYQPSNPIVASDSFMETIVQQPQVPGQAQSHNQSQSYNQSHSHNHSYSHNRSQGQSQHHPHPHSYRAAQSYQQNVLRDVYPQEFQNMYPRERIQNASAPFVDGGRIYVSDANYDAEADDRRKSWKWIQHSDRLSKTKRLPNAYMVFCNKWREFVRTNNPELDHRQVTSKLGEMWRILEDTKKQEYHEQAKILQQSTPDYPADSSRSPSSSDEMEDSMPTNQPGLGAHRNASTDSYHV